jgi:hypothetical protein
MNLRSEYRSFGLYPTAAVAIDARSANASGQFTLPDSPRRWPFLASPALLAQGIADAAAGYPLSQGGLPETTDRNGDVAASVQSQPA